MNPYNSYYTFNKCINKKICNKIIKISNKFKKGVITRDKGTVDLKIRDSLVTFTSEDWLYKLISPYLNTANKEAKWNYEHSWIEALQITKYVKNQFYDWHFDAHELPYEDTKSNYYGKIRKISFSLNLTDSNKYEGGELEFAIPGKKLEYRIESSDLFKDQGSLIFFPSFVKHRVTPVTKGTRYSLVGWVLGDPYK